MQKMVAGCIRIAGKSPDIATALGNVALKKEVERLQQELARVTEDRDRLVAFKAARVRAQQRSFTVKTDESSYHEGAYLRAQQAVEEKYFQNRIRRERRKQKLLDFIHLFVVREEDAE